MSTEFNAARLRPLSIHASNFTTSQPLIPFHKGAFSATPAGGVQRMQQSFQESSRGFYEPHETKGEGTVYRSLQERTISATSNAQVLHLAGQSRSPASRFSQMSISSSPRELQARVNIQGPFLATTDSPMPNRPHSDSASERSTPSLSESPMSIVSESRNSPPFEVFRRALPNLDAFTPFSFPTFVLCDSPSPRQQTSPLSVPSRNGTPINPGSPMSILPPQSRRFEELPAPRAFTAPSSPERLQSSAASSRNPSPKTEEIFFSPERLHLKVFAGHFDAADRYADQLLLKDHADSTYSSIIQLKRNLGNETGAFDIADRKIFSPFILNLAIQIQEKLNVDTRKLFEAAERNPSKQPLWQTYKAYALHMARKEKYPESQALLSKSLEICSSVKHSQYQVWLQKASVAALQNSPSDVDAFFNRALRAVPQKARSEVFLARARIEEYRENLEEAEIFLEKARLENSMMEWRPWCASILFYLRHDRLQDAQVLLQDTLRFHPNIGRIIALGFSMDYSKENEEMLKARFDKMLDFLPKSGDIICEWGKFLNNPLNRYYDPDAAEQAFIKAMHLTPQYGDPLIELVNLRVQRGSSVDIRQLAAGMNPYYGFLWSIAKQNTFDSTIDVLARVRSGVANYSLKRMDYTEKMIINRTPWPDNEDYTQSMSALGFTPKTLLYTNPIFKRILADSLLADENCLI